MRFWKPVLYIQVFWKANPDEEHNRHLFHYPSAFCRTVYIQQKQRKRKDLLTTVSEATVLGNNVFYLDEGISYDGAGYPASYRGKSLDYRYGLLYGYTYFLDDVDYAYNSEGIRVGKSVNGTETEYIVSGSRILEEKRGNHSIVYLYDEKSEPVGFEYDGTLYIYIKNGTSDITGIADEDGNLLCSYVYEGYGKCDIIEYDESSIGEINPLRYRGYYYDEESGFYYLNSRYYDPETGRFILPDDVSYLGAGGTVLSYNLFSCCENNPVNKIDEDGNISILISFMIGLGIGALTGIGYAAACDYNDNNSIDGSIGSVTYLNDGLWGALIGGATGGLLGALYSNINGYSGRQKTLLILSGVGIGGLIGGVIGYFVAPAIVNATGYSAYSFTLEGGITGIPSQLTGQKHHILSKKIMRALEKTSLKGSFNRNDSVVQALYDISHKGYQKWHREIDNTIVKWLMNNPNATKTQFLNELYRLYNKKDIIKRFGEGALNVIKALMK